MTMKKVHFAMIEAGGGHKMPALAVKESLEEQFPGKYDLRVLDFMKDLGCEDLDLFHKKTWKYLLSHPELTKGIQTFDFITGPVNTQIYKVLMERFSKYVVRYLYDEKPDMIFSTHYFNTMGVAHIRRKFGIGPILVNYLTEVFDFDSYWHLRDVDYYIVASERAQRKLLKQKFPKEKLFVFPYPVRKAFFRVSRGKHEILADLGLSDDRPTMLITLGGEGIGDIGDLIRHLASAGLRLNLIFVAGRNDELKRALERDLGSGRSDTRFAALGFTDRMNELISVSDFCFIKPGPATTWEVMSFRRPVIFFESAQLSENPNIQYAVENGLGFYAGNNPKKVVEVVNKLLDPATRAACDAAYESVSLQNGADAIAGFLDGILSP